jgi:hypothetical protein
MAKKKFKPKIETHLVVKGRHSKLQVEFVSHQCSKHPRWFKISPANIMLSDIKAKWTKRNFIFLSCLFLLAKLPCTITDLSYY